MGLFGSKIDNKDYNRTKNYQQYDQQHQAINKVLSTDPDSYKKPSNPVSEQAKQKLSTSARYKAVFSQGNYKLYGNFEK